VEHHPKLVSLETGLLDVDERTRGPPLEWRNPSAPATRPGRGTDPRRRRGRRRPIARDRPACRQCERLRKKSTINTISFYAGAPRVRVKIVDNNRPEGMDVEEEEMKTVTACNRNSTIFPVACTRIHVSYYPYNNIVFMLDTHARARAVTQSYYE